MNASIDPTTGFIELPENDHVGQILFPETDRVRVCARPGERLKVHAHQLDYFWTIHGPGRARNYQSDGTHSKCISYSATPGTSPL